MELIQFGNTGIKTTKIGLGLAALGRPGYINLGHKTDLNEDYDVERMKEHTHRMLDLAYQRGIRYFDAARSYGKAEYFLSEWLENKQDIAAGSKWGYTYTAGWKVNAVKHEIKEHSLQVLDRQWPESSGLLGDCLKIYHIHSASLESGVLDNKKVLDRLWELKNSGMVIGLSLSGTHQSETLDRALGISRDGKCLFQSVQVTWNILERSTTAVLQKAKEAGFGVIVKEALANGRLTARNSDPSFSSQLRVIQNLSFKYEVGVDAIAIAYVLNQPWVNIVLSGAATESQLRSNLHAQHLNLEKEDIEALDQLVESPAEYWRSRSLLEWN